MHRNPHKIKLLKVQQVCLERIPTPKQQSKEWSREVQESKHCRWVISRPRVRRFQIGNQGTRVWIKWSIVTNGEAWVLATPMLFLWKSLLYSSLHMASPWTRVCVECVCVCMSARTLHLRLAVASVSPSYWAAQTPLPATTQAGVCLAILKLTDVVSLLVRVWGGHDRPWQSFLYCYALLGWEEKRLCCVC